jgi:hypothetical protein
MKPPTCLACYRLSRKCGCPATCARCVAKTLRRKRKTKEAT